MSAHNEAIRLKVEQMCDKFVQDIGEFVDASQVVVTMPMNGLTVLYHKGEGNMYARIGALEAVAERLRDSDDIDPDEVFSE